MSAYYLSTTGTDDGSHGTSPGAGAWRTLTYALNTGIPTTGGPHTLIVADGTYSETVGIVSRAFGSMITVLGNVASPASVVFVSNTTNKTQFIRFNGAGSGNVTFSGCTIQANGTGDATDLILLSGGAANCVFSDCVLTVPSGATSNKAINCANTFLGGLTVERCVITATAPSVGGCIKCAGSSTLKPANFTISGCTLSSTGSALEFTDVDAVSVTGCSIKASGPYGILMGYDAGAPLQTGAITVSATNIRATGSTTHSILLGMGSVGSMVKDCMVDGYAASSGYGVVCKGSGDAVKDCMIVCGAVNGLYLKGCDNVSCERCSLIQPGWGSAIATATQNGRAPTYSTIRDCALVAPFGTCLQFGAHGDGDDVRISSVWGPVGVAPSHGYGSPHTTSCGPMLPNQHRWSFDT